MPRLFFALLPTTAQAEALVARVAPLVQALDGRPAPASNVHATLCFLGAVEDAELATLRAAASQVRGRGVELTFDALDYWETPGILCATASGGESARDLSLALHAAVSAARFTPDDKPFRAHLTLARKVRRASARNFEWPQVIAPVIVRCESFVLMQSRREAAGSTYSVVDSWPLIEK